jgi:tripartite-type tricarboxylate transporter receptor subunit TctC
MPGSPASYDEKAVASFYRGKTVTILVGHSAGGGFDTYARVISRHLGKYIPGNPNLVVNNMPGAGTIISANYTFNQAPKTAH